MDRLQSILALSPVKIAGIYIVGSIGWIVSSDTFAAWLARSQAELSRIQTVKGWVFVVASGLLILGLTSYRERQLEATQDRFRIANQHLHVLHRVLRHNIRNNMNVVMGYLQLIDEHGKPSVREYARNALVATQDFCEMADKLRIIDDMDPNDPGAEAINLVSLIDSVRSDILENHPEVRIQADLPGAAYVNGNSGIRIIIEELLQNAIEHCDRPTADLLIEISVDRNSEAVSITISDNGPGIHADELAALESGQETKLLHTSGAGLWLVTWVVELFGGEIDFDTSHDGTTVTLTFPRSSTVEYFAEAAKNEIKSLDPSETPS